MTHLVIVRSPVRTYFKRIDPRTCRESTKATPIIEPENFVAPNLSEEEERELIKNVNANAHEDQQYWRMVRLARLEDFEDPAIQQAPKVFTKP